MVTETDTATKPELKSYQAAFTQGTVLVISAERYRSHADGLIQFEIGREVVTVISRSHLLFIETIN